MKIAIGSDHRGYQLKGRLVSSLKELGHDVVDVGTHDRKSVDYTDYAEAVSRKVADGEVARGILICGTGIGMAIAANKFPGVRTATVHDELTAEMCRRHNDVNVLSLSGDMLGDRPIDAMLSIWLNAPFEGGRHGRRVDKIRAIEDRLAHAPCDSASRS